MVQSNKKKAKSRVHQSQVRYLHKTNFSVLKITLILNHAECYTWYVFYYEDIDENITKLYIKLTP